MIGIERPEAGTGELARVELAAGGVATSTSARRRWTGSDGRPLHHLLDPRTGLPAVAGPAGRPVACQVTTVSATAWWAEVLAIVVFLDGELDDPSAAALVVGDDGRTRTLGDPAWFALDQERVA